MITSKRARALLTATALVPTLVIVLIAVEHAQNAAGAKVESRVSAPATPSAATFAAEFIGVTNQYATEHGDTSKAGHAQCVQARPGHYMCSYTVTKNDTIAKNETSTCHLMQARWTPDRASTITVTLAGRTARCGTLREAIWSLG
jgi:hypothetical protein